MTRDAFEQLLSEWLDARDRSELTDAIERAVEAEPSFRQTRDAWLQADGALRRTTTIAREGVTWSAFRAGLSQRLDGLVENEMSQDDGFADAVWGATALPGGVDWNAARIRISAAVEDTGRPARDGVLRLRISRPLAGFAIGLAAALVLALAFRPAGLPIDALHGGVALARIETTWSVAPAAGGMGMATIVQPDSPPENEQPAKPAGGVPEFLLLSVDEPHQSPDDALVISSRWPRPDREVSG